MTLSVPMQAPGQDRQVVSSCKRPRLRWQHSRRAFSALWGKGDESSKDSECPSWKDEAASSFSLESQWLAKAIQERTNSVVACHVPVAFHLTFTQQGN